MFLILICFMIFTGYTAVCEEDGTYVQCPCCIIDGCLDCLTTNECAFWHCVEDKVFTNFSMCKPIPEAAEAPTESCIYGGYWAKIDNRDNCPVINDNNSLSGVAIFFIVVGCMIGFLFIVYTIYATIECRRHGDYAPLANCPVGCEWCLRCSGVWCLLCVGHVRETVGRVRRTIPPLPTLHEMREFYRH